MTYWEAVAPWLAFGVILGWILNHQVNEKRREKLARLERERAVMLRRQAMENERQVRERRAARLQEMARAEREKRDIELWDNEL